MSDSTFLVREAEKKDVGRGFACLHPEDMKALGISTGEILQIKGANKTTAVKAFPALVGSRQKLTVQIDGITRGNAGADIGKTIEVKRIELEQARMVTLEPLDRRTSLSQRDSQAVRQFLETRPLSGGDRVRITLFGNRYQEFLVTSLAPEGPCLVTSETKVVLAVKGEPSGQMSVTYEDIGGLGLEIGRVREMVELPLKHPELFERVGIDAPKGVLLYGPPGCGKTLIARAVASEVRANFFSISGPEIMVKWVGESAERLRNLFKTARQKAPAIIFIDEIDAAAPKRESLDVGGAAAEQHKDVVTQLCTLMDGLESRGEVVVIGATNMPDLIDPALRRPGRFDREIEIGVPDEGGRQEILEIHTRAMPLAEDVGLEEIARRTHGFVGADIAALSREAAMNALRKILPIIDLDYPIPREELAGLYVTARDFEEALSEAKPSALREVYLERPNVSWKDVGGLEAVKQALREAVEWPLTHEELFNHMATKPPKGIMLSGPPGCGKTLIAKALANESGVNFISVKGPELMSRWVGETERGVREIFRKARQHAPCIIFFDEIEAIAPRRGRDTAGVTDRALSQLLAEIDGVEELKKVVILAATNRIDLVDEAMLRPGRTDVQLKIFSPDRAGRLEIFKVHTLRKPLNSDVVLDLLAELTDDCSGADIAGICQRASLLAMQEFIKAGIEDIKECLISQRHFKAAFEQS